jgi:hypothetical protein
LKRGWVRLFDSVFQLIEPLSQAITDPEKPGWGLRGKRVSEGGRGQ